jgi:hypothetical protein
MDMSGLCEADAATTTKHAAVLGFGIDQRGFLKAGTTNKTESWMPGLERCRVLESRDNKQAGILDAGT